MKSVLVVDDMAVFREPICAALERAGYRVQSASNGRDALRVAASATPDVIVLDLAMPVMDGLKCIEGIRRNPATAAIPVILLTVFSDKKIIARAAKLGVQGYLLKSRFSLTELFARINAVTSSEAAPVHAIAPPPDPAPPPSAACKKTREEILALVGERLDLRAGPIVLQNLTQLTLSSQSSAKEVADVVRQDHALAIKVLRVANSSLFGAGHRAKTITDAVHRLGMEGVRNAVAAILAVECFNSASSGGIVPRLFWEHSVATAIIADALGHALAMKDCEHVFLAGLFHDIGRLLLSEIVPDEYRTLVNSPASSDIVLVDAERRAWGLDHAEVTREVLRNLNSPQALVEAASLHESTIHQIKELARQPENAMVVALANRLAHALLFVDNLNGHLYPIHGLAAELGLDDERLATTICQAAERVQETQILFASHASNEKPETIRDIIAKHAKPSPRVRVLATPSRLEPCSHFLRALDWLQTDSPRAVLAYIDSETDLSEIGRDLQRLDTRVGRPLPLLVVRADSSSPELSPPVPDRNIISVILPASHHHIADALIHLTAAAPREPRAAVAATALV